MDMGFFLQKERIFQAPIKLAQPFPAPELRTNNCTDTRIFLISNFSELFEDQIALQLHYIILECCDCLLAFGREIARITVT